MKRLCKELIKNRSILPASIETSIMETSTMENLPEKVVQFGEGNFLRAFADWMIHEMNKKGLFNGKVIVIQPIEHGMVSVINEQDGLYTLIRRGVENGEKIEKIEIISSISKAINPYEEWEKFLECATGSELRFIISNTTEAGIAFLDEERPIDKCPASFPAKLTAFLYRRYLHFKNVPGKGMIVLPCELIEHNGCMLKSIVLNHAERWCFEPGFERWINEENFFLNTLVDGIVTGYPEEESIDLSKKLGYSDDLLDISELYHLWAIEGDERFAGEMPLKEAGFNVIWTEDISSYKALKVGILNGTHTMTAPAGYLSGRNTVGECIMDSKIREYMQRGIYDEIIPVIDLPDDIKMEYADTVFSRFENPFIRHNLLSISLNSVSKYRARVLPILLKYINNKEKVPCILSFSLSALFEFYRGVEYIDDKVWGARGNELYQIRDDNNVLAFFKKAWGKYDEDRNLSSFCDSALSMKDFWDLDLNCVNGLNKAVEGHLENILKNGITNAIESILT